MDSKENTCCFTGHRELPEEEIPRLERRLREMTEVLIGRGFTHFCAGGARGFDMLAELAVLDIKAGHPDIRLTLVVPYGGQDTGWPFPDALKYDQIIKAADTVIQTSAEYCPGCIQQRNLKMVEMSGFCVCYLKGDTGGTAYTALYAKRCGLPVVNLAEAQKYPAETELSAGKP